MTGEKSRDDLRREIARLKSEISQQTRFQEITQALFRISSAVNTTAHLADLYAAIHRILGHVIDTTNFFIARYDAANDSVSFPYCIDTVDECYPPVLDISGTESQTAQVLRSGRPVLITGQEILHRRANSKRRIPSCTPCEIWLGVPLKTPDTIVGVMAVQSYTHADLFDETDLELMVSVADQVALAIERKQHQDRNETLVKELTQALDEVKTLQGFLPICANCKKVRDDGGYWQAIEAYIQDHSDAVFSHGICPECAHDLYPDLDLF
ncbi:MAG: GAF domain-containing protein [Desulfobacterales bacterium]|nr:GAF domain-containing protein [Desulfobacterales bacterium]